MPTLNPIQHDQRQRILRFYGLEHASLLASGTEADVYARDEKTLLKLYTGGERRAEQLELLRDFYRGIVHTTIPLPTIHDIRRFEMVIAVIETRLEGRPLDDYLPNLQGADLERAENLYLDAVFSMKELRLKETPSRYFLFDKITLSDSSRQSFASFYAASLREKSTHVGPFFQSFDSDFSFKAEALITAIQNQPRAALSIIHGDLFPGNILVNEVGDRVTGIIDFGSFTQFGNFLLDVAGAFGFYKMYDPDHKAIRAALLPRVLSRLTETEQGMFFQFLLANAIMTSDFYAQDVDPRNDGHFQWAVDIVSDVYYWQKALRA